MLRGIALALLVFGVTSCSAEPPAKVPVPPIAPEPSSKPSAARSPSSGALSFPEATRAFEQERVTGTMALFDTRGDKLLCSDPARCEKGYSPASTFKIANTIIGLETGVLSDAETAMPWDGKEYSVPAWNQDHTLRSAIQVSCVPCFQRVAREVGKVRMQEWVTRLDYGNHNISGKIDRFWLDGGLRISPFQELDFLRRLDAGKLPISEHTLDVVRDVITLDVAPDYVLRGKTGLVQPPEEPSLAGWFVGFVELGERRVFFATLIDGSAPDVDLQAVRRRLTERVLRELGDLPS